MSVRRTPGTIMRGFTSILKDMEQNVADYVLHPGKDFTRHRVLPFGTTMRMTVFMRTSSLQGEILDYWAISHSVGLKGFPENLPIPSRSAFIQQRAKLNDKAFPDLLARLNNKFPLSRKLRGLHCLACDGSDLNIPPTPGDDSTFISYNSNNGGYHQLHLTAMYDLLEKRFTDFVVQPRSQVNEHDACVTLVNRNSLPGKFLYIMDRGFDSFKVMAAVARQNQYYLIRLKDPERFNSPFRALLRPDSPRFDVSDEFFLSRSRRPVPGIPDDKLKFIRPDRAAHLFAPGDRSSLLHLPFRFIKLSQGNAAPVYFVTNLPSDKFPLSDFDNLYHLRWGIETSFLFLKYNAALAFPHSIKRCLQIQEICARLVFFNLVSLIVSSLQPPHDSSAHPRQIAFSQAFRFCRFFFAAPKPPSNSFIAAALLRDTVPSRPDKSRHRLLRSQRLHSFQNRA